MKNNVLIIMATVIVTFMLILINCQHNQINKYKQLLELVDTTKTTDTLYLEKTVIDSVPKLVTTTITKRDTLYKDSIPYILTLKKKVTVIQS